MMVAPAVVSTPGLDESERWMVVWTESRAEKRVESRMAAKGFKAWLPTFVERRRWSDRWRNVTLPLFPGYLFVSAREKHLQAVLATPGVLTVVKSGSGPALLSGEFVASLQRAVQAPDTSPSPVDPCDEYGIADEVVVRRGPLAGLRGVVRDVRGAQRLIVWIEHLGRGVAFTMQASVLAHAE